MNFATTGTAHVTSDKICLLYSAGDGSIRYMHRVVTLAGAEEIPASAIEKRARELAKQAGARISRCKALHVDAGKLRPHMRYAVDVGKARLVEIGTVDGSGG